MGLRKGCAVAARATLGLLFVLLSGRSFAQTTDTIVNWAASANGGTVSVSSTASKAASASTLNDGDRIGSAGSWQGKSSGKSGDWAQITFAAAQTIGTVTLISPKDNPVNAAEPVESDTFAQSGTTDFDVQIKNGSNWTTVASIKTNHLVKRTVSFAPTTTTAIRIVGTAGTLSAVEIEAWGANGIGNVAAASAQAVAKTNSSYGPMFPASALNDGKTSGATWGLAQDGGWANGSRDPFPNKVEVIFPSFQVINAVTLWTLQDDHATASSPDDSTTFTQDGLTAFDVQVLSDDWVTVASVTANNLVKRTVTFSPIIASRIRVVSKAGLNGYARIVELQAWGIPSTGMAHLTGMDPRSGMAGDTVTLYGENFSTLPQANSVAFNGVAAKVTHAEAGLLQVIVPSGAATGPVSVVTKGWTSGTEVPFTVMSGAAPMVATSGPNITSFSPAWGPPGTIVTINGTGFSATKSQDTVRFGNVIGQVAQINTATTTTLTVVAPSGGLSGLLWVTVNGMQASSSSIYEYPPVIDFTNPTSGAVDDAVTISGSNLARIVYATFAGGAVQNAVSRIDASNAAVRVPGGAQSGPITLTSASGLVSNASPSFTVYIPPPTITDINPTSGVVGTTVTITGTNFSPTAASNSVSFNGTPATVTAATATSLTTTVPAGATSGAVIVTVNGMTATGPSFTVQLPAPTISSINPDSGPCGSTVVINGTNFSPTLANNQVFFTDASTGNTGIGASITAATATALTVVVPLGAGGGFVSVTVSGAVGGATSPSAFTVTVPVPTITGFTPQLGPVGTSVTITGTNFSATAANNVVKFNGTVATVVAANTTSLTVTVPSGATSGKIAVTVSSSQSGIASQTATSAADYTVGYPPVTITGFTPTSGPVGTQVTVSGTNFGASQGIGNLQLNGVMISPTNWSDTAITFTVTAGASSGPITVVNNNRQSATTSNSFSIPAQAAAFVSQNVPSSMVAGTTASVSVTMQNIGTASWTAAQNYKLGSQNNQDWGVGQRVVIPPGATVAPGQNITFNFVITAPATAGNSTFVWQMLQEGGAWFGATSPATNIVINAGTPTISGISPASGPRGTTVVISGTNFLTTLANNQAYFTSASGNPDAFATVTAATPTSLTVTVPNNAVSGPFKVAVTGAVNSATSNSPFAVTVPTPTITGFNPSLGPVGTPVTITGTNFDGNTLANNAVKFNGIAATVTAASATSLTATVPSSATSGRIAVTVSSSVSGITSQTATSVADYTVGYPPVTITGFTPTSGQAGTQVTISGTNFGASQGSGNLQINGAMISPSSWSDTSIVVSIPPGATSGPFTVVSNVHQNATSSASFTVLPSPPTITDVSPTSGLVGATVTITGTNFSTTAANNSVKFNGTAATVTAASTTSLTTTVPAGATSGAVSVTVNAMTATGPSFTVLLPAPTISTISPSSGPRGTTMVINGGNFSTTASNNQVYFTSASGSQDAFATVTAATPTSLTVTVPNNAVSGFFSVAVTGAVSSTTSNIAFTVTVPVPTITGFSPSIGPEGTPVTITGTNFGATTANNAVKFNGIAATVTAASTTSLTATVPSGATSGKIAATVSSSQSGIVSQTATSTADYTVGYPPVTITGITPTSGPYGTVVTVTGTNFGASQGIGNLQLNGAMMAPTTWSDTAITFTVPDGATDGPITVVSSARLSASSAPFTITNPTPNITGFTPVSGQVGDTVTISGANFSSIAAANIVKFNGVAASVISADSANVQAKVPAGATSGKLSVSVNSKTGTSASDFTVIPTVTIASITPASGPTNTVVTIDGSNFDPVAANNAVQISGVLQPILYASANKLRIQIARGTFTGPVTVYRTGPITVSGQGPTFTLAAPPQIQWIAPISSPTSTQVTLHGARFDSASTSANTVTVNGITAAVTRATASELDVWVPPGATSGQVVVTNKYGTSSAMPVRNVASAWSGATASASSTKNAAYDASGAIDSDIAGGNWGAGGGWSDATSNAFPDSLQVGFATEQKINDVIVYTLQDNFASGTDPTDSTTFTQYGLTAFDVQALQGSTWITVASVTGNNRVKRRVVFMPIVTTAIRVVANGSADSQSSRIVEVEAHYDPSNFIVGPVPTAQISDFTPKQGGPGTQVTITGQFFGSDPLGIGRVYFFTGQPGGQPAQIVSWSDTAIVVNVPVGAYDGPISVATPSRNFVTSAATFDYVPPPVKIDDFTPTHGRVVFTNVTLNGSGFSAVADENKVTFSGNADGKVLQAGYNSLIVQVPSGAQTGPITAAVTIDGATQSITSSSAFTVDPTPALDAQLIRQWPFGKDTGINPTTYEPGATVQVEVTMQNTGLTPWPQGQTIRLAELDSTGWVASKRADWTPSATIAVGDTATFTFPVQAPATPGVYAFHWQMIQDSPTPAVRFGSVVSAIVYVGSPPPQKPLCVFQTAPSTIPSMGETTIQWQAPTTGTTPDGYRIAASEDGATWSAIQGAAAGTRSVTFTTTARLQYYAVAACENTPGNACSSFVPAQIQVDGCTSPPPTTAPNPPTSVTATPPASGSTTGVSWVPASTGSTATYFLLEVANSAGGPWTIVNGHLSATPTSTTYTAPSNGTYYFGVQACNNNNECSALTVSTAVTIGGANPSSCAGLSVSTTSIIFEAKETTGAKVYVHAPRGCSWTVSSPPEANADAWLSINPITGQGSDTSDTLVNLTPKSANANASSRAVTLSIGGDGVTVAVAVSQLGTQGTTIPGAPAVPAGVITPATTNDPLFLVTWTPNTTGPAPTYYQLYQGSSANGPWLLIDGNITTAQSSYLVEYWDSVNPAYFYLVACNAVGCTTSGAGSTSGASAMAASVNSSSAFNFIGTVSSSVSVAGQIVSSPGGTVYISGNGSGASAPSAGGLEQLYVTQLKPSFGIEPLGENAFGEQVDPVSGQLSFMQKDVDFRGIGPDIKIYRRFEMPDATLYYPNPAGGFADWTLELPRITAAIPAGTYWGVQEANTNNLQWIYTWQRCSQFNLSGGTGGRDIAKWQGVQLVIPGSGTQEIMLRATENNLQPDANAALGPTGGAFAFPLVTTEHWQIGCLASTSNGAPGEAFYAVSPDGTKYWFDNFTNGFVNNAYRASMLVSKIQDRFGNTVQFIYSTQDGTATNNPIYSLPIEIKASDGRDVLIDYEVPNGTFVKSITLQSSSVAPKIYSYSHDLGYLKTVTLPDNSQWSFDLSALEDICVNGRQYQTPSGGNCLPYGSVDNRIFTGSVQAPSGLKGTFGIQKLIRAHYGNITQFNPAVPAPSGNVSVAYRRQRLWEVPSLVSKTYSGSGIPAQTWSYSYVPSQSEVVNWSQSYVIGSDTSYSVNGITIPNFTLSPTTTVTTTYPDNTQSVATFDNNWNTITDGDLLSVNTLDASGHTVSSSSYGYALPDTGPFPGQIGKNPVLYANWRKNQVLHPRKSLQTQQDGDTYQWNVDTFDTYGRPARVTRGNSAGSSISETTSYYNDTAHWVVGLTASIANAVTGEVEHSYTYDPTNALLLSRSNFDKLMMSYGWNTQGLLQSFTDPNNNATNLSNYKLGVPRLVQFPDGTSMTDVVDDLGQVTSVTDQVGATTKYHYDGVGRVIGIDYPTGDTIAWNATNITYQTLTDASSNLYWQRTETRGNSSKVTSYDARWQPILTVMSDTTNPNGAISQAMSYDWRGALTFKSYAQNDSSTPLTTGQSTEYDALGRVVKQKQDSELGMLTTNTAYSSGVTKTVTDPKGNLTRTTYQAYDVPNYEAPLSITLTEGVIQTIARDSYGNPLSITQSGPIPGQVAPVTVTRNFAYDAYKRLCRLDDPERGSELRGYDVANNLSWGALGQNAVALGPDANGCVAQTSVPASALVTHGYDAMNRVTSIVYPSGTDDASFTYDGRGAIQTAISGGTSWTNVYKKLGVLESETLAVDGKSFALGYRYDANGNPSGMTYPGGQSIDYAPDALGRPTQAGSFASSVSYFANGKARSFTYGNGIAYTANQNARQILSGLSYKNGNTLFDEAYTFDKNANITAVTDQSSGAQRSKTMVYDGLDRLIRTGAAQMWSNECYQYDGVNNLRAMTTGSTDAACTNGGQTQSYAYDGNNRLGAFTDASGNHAYGYDVRGNVTQNRDGATLSFDLANRMTGYQKGGAQNSYLYDASGRRVKTVNASGTTYSVYSSAGKLMTEQSLAGSTNYVHLNEQLIAKQGPGGTTYLHTDHLGSPVVQSDVLGNALNQAEYKPFGTVWFGGTTSGIGFTGHYNDGDTGLTYMQARYYDPIAARFLSADSVGASSKNFNRYWYANNNPYKNVDLDGRDAVWVENQNGSKTLLIPVRITGSGVTGSKMAELIDRASQLSTGDSNVSISIRYTDIPTRGVLNHMDFSPGYNRNLCPDAGECAQLGGTQGHINSENENSIGALLHDILHFAGITDQYHDDITKPRGANNRYPSAPNEGYDSKNIMVSRSGTELKSEQLREAKNNSSTREVACNSESAHNTCP